MPSGWLPLHASDEQLLHKDKEKAESHQISVVPDLCYIMSDEITSGFTSHSPQKHQQRVLDNV